MPVAEITDLAVVRIRPGRVPGGLINEYPAGIVTIVGQPRISSSKA